MRAGTTFSISLYSHAACHIAILYTDLALINTHRLIPLQSILSSPVLIPEFQTNISSRPLDLFSQMSYRCYRLAMSKTGLTSTASFLH